MSATSPPQTAETPEINVFVVSFLLFFSYMLLTAVVSLALTISAHSIHPATRMFIWFVLAASIGYGLLRRHGRYPKRSRLIMVLALSIMFFLMMSVSAMLRLSHQPISTYIVRLCVSSTFLFIIGAFGFWTAEHLFHRIRGG